VPHRGRHWEDHRQAGPADRVNPANHSAFNGSDAFPDGTIIAKSLNRPVGCTLNGLSAVFKCPGGINSANPSILTAVDPKGLKVLSSVQLAGNFSSRITTTPEHSTVPPVPRNTGRNAEQIPRPPRHPSGPNSQLHRGSAADIQVNLKTAVVLDQVDQRIRPVPRP